MFKLGKYLQQSSIQISSFSAFWMIDSWIKKKKRNGKSLLNNVKGEMKETEKNLSCFKVEWLLVGIQRSG